MRAMEYTSLPEQFHRYPRTFTFLQVPTQSSQKRFDITPWHIAGDRVRKNRLQGTLVLAFHV